MTLDCLRMLIFRVLQIFRRGFVVGLGDGTHENIWAILLRRCSARLAQFTALCSGAIAGPEFAERTP